MKKYTLKHNMNVPFRYSLIGGVVVQSFIYLFIALFATSQWKDIIFNRGAIQYMINYCAGVVIAFLLFKGWLLVKSYKDLEKDFCKDLRLNEIQDITKLFDPDSKNIKNCATLLKTYRCMVAERCYRVLYCFQRTKSRVQTIDFAVDDSTFYQSSSKTSYMMPRILVWAIPLLGFVGTVLGISMAVSGFSTFLSGADVDIVQMKEGIGNVTVNLGVAFDTTLLALLVSILIMLPMTWIERQENRLLLAIDIYISDNLLAYLKEPTMNDIVQDNLRKNFEDVIKSVMPSHKDFVILNEEIKSFKAIAASLNSIKDKFEDYIKVIREYENQLTQNYKGILEQYNRNENLLISELDNIKYILNSHNIKVTTLYQNIQDMAQDIRQLEQHLSFSEDSNNLQTTLNEINKNLSELREQFLNLDEINILFQISKVQNNEP